MTTYTWPTARHFMPAAHELRVIDNTQRTVESSLSGYVQTNAMPGARWGWGMDFTPHTQAQRAELEAYLLRLSGRQHRVQLWDLRNPRPRGNIGLAGVTLGATAAQFATSLTLAGCRGVNALLGGSFEQASGGIGVGWSRYASGATGALTQLLDNSPAFFGAFSQYLGAATLGASPTDRNGIVQSAVPVAHFAGQQVTGATTLRATASTQVAMYVVWRDGGGGVVSENTIASIAATGSDQTLSGVVSCPSSAVTADVYIWQHSGTGGLCLLNVDGARLVSGTSAGSYPGPATLLAGDWLGLAGGQLVRVVADATANDAGAMTVEVRHMLRTAVASGTAVTLDKPAALFVRTEAGLSMPRQPGLVDPGMSVEFVEVFA